MIVLRPYQNKGVGKVRNFFAGGGKHALFQGPTGSGKTVEFCYIAQQIVGKKKKVLILTDRIELLTQTGGTMEEFAIQPFLIRAGTKFINFDHNVYIAMCQTLRNRIDKKMWWNWIKNKIDLVIIDEAHKQDFNYIFQSGLVDNKFVLGFTATPKRTGKMRQLALDYETIIETVTVKDLIDQEYLVADDYFGVNGVNLNNIKIDKKKGDYDEKEMFTKFNSAKLYAGVVKNWKQHANNTKTLIFCVNIEHVIHTCEEFVKNGIEARFLVSKKGVPREPDKDAEQGKWTQYEERMRLYDLYTEKYGLWSGDRTYIIEQFKRGEFQVLINAGILTTGFDDPTIETIVVNRATLSVALWLQMIGRGSRQSFKKTHFNLLDFGDNATRLGHYSAPQGWHLWHEERNSGDGVAPVKDCGRDSNGIKLKDKQGKVGCERLILAAYKICPFCGYMYTEKEAKEIDLQTIAYDDEKHMAIKVKKISEMDLDELKIYVKMKQHKQPWLWRQLYYRGGIELIEKFGKENRWRRGTIEKAINYVSDLKEE